ncbi:NACHT domain-containing protein [Methylomonas albis]|uniref:AAA+ ATPase domain-containing protein n=1 Tax=Methylomonas albis TaxID=1854563 RepID=A0ABR9CW76_9GAMM|nr:hypothetical protein [Methylomonas albis]MBD9355111.1 hypothetical protein [Methylomonas albis]
MPKIMDYDLSRLSTRSFEQLIQSLAHSVVGPGIVIFGDGPDGGREATFEGNIAFPNNAERWQGYGIVQAKFKQRPEGSGKDGDWALQELKDELKKFTSAESKLKKPEYYIFATNVVLTPVAEVGGKDKLTRHLESQKVKLGLKDFRIWDYDQLRVMLDGCADVRTTYTAWITAGDVLAELIKMMQPQRHNFREVMTGYLQKELCADQYVNLNQAGHQQKDRILLAQVFVDLPTGDQLQPHGVIAGLLEIGSWNLSPKATPHEALLNLSSSATLPGRVVFIGGPGQGKTTLSQFLCQLHRVALLDVEDRQLISPEARTASALIVDQIAHEGLELPSMPRFPVRIVLNSFAADLAIGKATSLFDYLLRRIAHLSERTLTTDDLRGWLKAYPWLIVLDGLDEVPVSSNREQVIDSVQNFLIDAQACNADLLLVATTRPQGYNNDFSPAYYRHFELLPLAVPRALHYADRLLEQRWGGDRDKIDTLTQRLQRAGAEEATARLMRSPLQVTIMAMLVENVGQPPRERWRLFNDYYDVIYKREQQRDIPAAELLNSYKADIDAIHQRVGLRLQTISEQSGGTAALLPQAEFAELIKQRLAGEGHAGADCERLQADIVNASIDRLVFLVAPQADKVGFEIRSLQEFMAAECLMNGSDQDVSQRLRAIAPAAHWRNVFLFAAGRCFHERQHLRDTLYTLCCELNEGEGIDGGELEKATLAGSRLALEILEDGALVKAPAQLKLFAKLALRLLELPPCEAKVRLANQYVASLEECFKSAIKERMATSDIERRLAAWSVLLHLDCQNIIWANELARNNWPSNAEESIQIIKSLSGVSKGNWLADKYAMAILNTSPLQSHYGNEKGWARDCSGLILHSKDWVNFYGKLEKIDETKICIEGVDDDRFEMSFVPIVDSKVSDLDKSLNKVEANKQWKWLIQAWRFSLGLGCSKSHLAELLQEFFGWTLNEQKSIGKMQNMLAWPISACISAVHATEEKAQLITAIKKGNLGDKEDWLSAQVRWENAGITKDDLKFIPERNLPFDNQIAKIGYPFDLPGATIIYQDSRGCCRFGMIALKSN